MNEGVSNSGRGVETARGGGGGAVTMMGWRQPGGCNNDD